jgi:hypothetical protein
MNDIQNFFNFVGIYSILFAVIFRIMEVKHNGK